MIIFLTSIIFLEIHFLIITLYSILISFVVTIQFNLYLYRKIKKAENRLNSLLYFIKIDFSLIQKIGKNQIDNCLNFIYLIIDYNITLSENYREILSKIHCGASPELELINCLYPSKDFIIYLKNLLTNNFQLDEYSDEYFSYSKEKDFKVYLKQITTKLSIVFFVGVFFPIGFCFLLFLLSLNKFMMIMFIPMLIIFLDYLFKKFISVNHYLIGFIQNDSNFEKQKLEEFLLLIKKFALNLRQNISPEKALIKAFNEEKENIPLLKSILEQDIILFLNGMYNFNQIINSFKENLKSFRYHTIINSIVNMLKENAYFSSYKIIEIINILNKHKKLENKLNVIIKGEKFKVFLFLFILPIITGSIGSLLPFLPEISKSLISLEELNDPFLFLNSLDLIDLGLILIILLASNLISSYYFLKIIFFRNKSFFMIISGIIFLLTFSLSIINIVNFIA
ncbi:MAG: hypothetical protein KGD63_10120 [Candidatus Lokiarchaeota archaeon]|nr:hypothetical protein [Candidatus Lokiarchaeota archaeon]